MLLFLWRLLSRVPGSRMQLKLQSFPVLSGPTAFQTVGDDLATWQAGSVSRAWHAAAASACRSQQGLLQRSLWYLCCGCWRLWATLCEARWRCSRGLGSDYVLQAGKAVLYLLPLLPDLPSYLNWCSVGLETLVTWIFAIQLFRKPRKSICRDIVVIQ